MKYNLVLNGFLKALTTAGTGNVDLTWPELYYLMDEETQYTLGANGITISGSDVLYLEADLSSRIEVDSIRLYMTSDTASGTILSDHLHFYYRNTEGSSYSLCSKSLADGYYLATVPSTSAPRYIACVISGTDAKTVYEFEVLSEDYTVAFGTDGQDYADYLDDTPIGSTGEPTAVAIYNNSNDAVNAYTCVNWTGAIADRYIEISSEEDGTYYSIDDGAILEDDLTTSEYRWSHGSHNGTVVSGDKVVRVSSYTAAAKSQIPLRTTSNNFNISDNAMTYDPINDKVYVMGSDGILKLWEYHMDTDTYTFRGEVWPNGSTTHQYWAAMIYLNGYIYAMKNYAGGWGRHDLSGDLSNWTTLASHPDGSVQTAPGKRALCTDGERYIYCIDHAGELLSTTKRFVRFDTVSLTWSSSLNTGYWADTPESYSMYNWLHYDEDGYIYYFGGLNGYSNSNWVQRYDVGANTWTQQYINTASFPSYSAALENKVMAYCNKQLWFSFSGYGGGQNKIWRYDISSSTVTLFTVDFSINYNSDYRYNNYCLAVPADNDLGVRLYFGNVAADRTRLYAWPSEEVSVYTTPIFKLEEAHNASYFVIEGTAVSGTGSISYDEDVYNGTIRIKSSDEEPIPLVEAWWLYFAGDRYATTVKYVPYTNIRTKPASPDVRDEGAGGWWRLNSIASNASSNIKQRLAFSFSDRYYTSASWNSFVYIIDRSSGSVLYSATYGPYASSSTAYKYYFNINMEFDVNGGIWGYGSTMNYLIHFNSTLGSELASIYDGSDFLYDLSVDYEGTGVWYTNQTTSQVIHLNSAGTATTTIIQKYPRALCANQDGTVWVNDQVDYKIRKFNSSGTLVVEYDVEKNFTRMRTDYNNGFWGYSSAYDIIFHYDSSGTKDLELHLDRIDGISTYYDGCVVFDNTANYYYFVNLEGAVYRSRSVETEVANCAMISITYDNDKEWDFDVVPVSYDPIWGSSEGELEWREVRKDGYFLSRSRFHQAEITLRGDAELERVVLAPAVEAQNISPGESKNIYARSNIPGSTDITEYETKFRTWFRLFE